MRRKIGWTQSPPNLDDYAPESVTGPAPFQLAPPEGKDESRGVKREGTPPPNSSTKALKETPKQNQDSG